MRKLRLVRLDDEGAAFVLETPDGREQFSLSNDERLRELSRVDLPRIGTIVSETATSLAPRDIQVRVRAGTDPQTLADEAKVPLERIMRFAYPVLQERLRVTDEARRGRCRRPDGQLVPFGDLIDDRMSIHGVDPSTVKWDAFRRHDGGWTVTASFDVDRKSIEPARVTTKFSFALASRTVSALDEVAADLLTDQPVAALLPPAPPVVGAPSPVAEAVLAVSEPPTRLFAVEDPVALVDEPVTAADDADPDGTTEVSAPEPSVSHSKFGRQGRRRRAHTHPLPVSVDDELFDQEALDDWQEPPLPLDLAQPSQPTQSPPASSGSETPKHARIIGEARTARTDEQPADGGENGEQSGGGRRARKAGDKPRMPSWDDILLGVRHKSD